MIKPLSQIVRRKHRHRQRIVCYRNCLYYPYKFSISVLHTYSVLSGLPEVSVQHVPMSLSQCEHTHPTCRARAGTTADSSSINTEIYKEIEFSISIFSILNSVVSFRQHGVPDKDPATYAQFWFSSYFFFVRSQIVHWIRSTCE